MDKNPFAVNLAKLSLWLITLARDLPFTFIDHALKHGDSLVGLTLDQIERFDWGETGERDAQLDWVDRRAAAARVDREALRVLGDRDERRKLELLEEAEAEVHEARLVGDLCVAAFFDGGSARERKELLGRYRGLVGTAAAEEVVEGLRGGERPVPPLHWELEFPEVFGRERAGFDAVVGNPPFLGGTGVSRVLGRSYLHWLLNTHPDSHGNGDVAAHFFRRAFTTLRPGGAFGLIATNTISQGDTRTTGLRWICRNGGSIYAARRRALWPGLASVVVSVVHVRRGACAGSALLDSRHVPQITAFLFHGGGHEDPSRLTENFGLTSLGSKIYGQGFLFDDSNRNGVSSPTAVMERLLRSGRNAERIFPDIGGSELNSSPTHAHHRYAINFGQLSLADAEAWPELIEIVREKVKPGRDRLREDTGPGAHGKSRLLLESLPEERAAGRGPLVLWPG